MFPKHHLGRIAMQDHCRSHYSPRRLSCASVALAGALFALSACSPWSKTLLAQKEEAPLLSPGQLISRSAALDADLNAVACLSAERIVAVGNCGAILVSGDGGRRWTKRNSPTEANLHGVAFWSEDQGLAVGCQLGKFTGTSEAVLLRTNDGGKNWELVPNDLPGLLGILISRDTTSQTQRIVVWGHYSPQHQTGVFVSNGGSGWAARQVQLGHIQALALGTHPQLGEVILAVDSAGRASMTNLHNGARPSVPVNLGSDAAAIRCLNFDGDRWIACGDGGLLRESENGLTWSRVETGLSKPAAQLCHWEFITQSGEELWVGGRPGSLMLRHRPSEDWTPVYTRQTMPLLGATFLDSRRGWAVGSCGRILASRDGGEAWYGQRHSEANLCLLSAVTHWSQTPWTALAATTWEEQQHAAVINFGKSELVEEADFLPSSSAQLKEFGSLLGVGTLREPSEKVTLEALASNLLTFRPSLVLLGQETELQNEMLSAIHLAASAQPDHPFWLAAQELGLEPWQVEKLALTQNKALTQNYSEQLHRILNPVGLALFDIIEPLPVAEIQRCESIKMQTFWSRSSNPAAMSSLLGGITTRGTTRREGQGENFGNFQLVMGRPLRQRTINSFIQRDGSGSTWLKDLKFAIASLPEFEIASALHSLASQLIRPDQQSRRDIVLQQLIERAQTKDRDAARWAMLERLKMASSQERVAWSNLRVNQVRKQPIALSQISHQHIAELPSENEPAESSGVDLSNSSSPWSTSPFQPPSSASSTDPVRFASATDTATADRSDETEQTSTSETPQEPGRDWFDQLGKYSVRIPDIIHRPDVQMLTFRESNGVHPQEGSHRLSKLIDAEQLVGWQQAAAQELRLENNQLQADRWSSVALRTPIRPRLDGILEEDIWSECPPIELSELQESSHAPALVRWAYDHQYLYIAATCPRPRPKAPIRANRIRQYDAELSELDHLEFTLDTDRDYTTAIQLAVAEDGQTYDRCCNQPEYNPKWHVAVRDTGDEWIAEVAIELKSLTTQPKVTGDAWAISVRRRPSANPQEQQSWSKLNSHQSILPGNGLLLFVPPL